MEKFTRVIAKEDIKTFDDAGIAQLGNLNKIIDEVDNVSTQVTTIASTVNSNLNYKVYAATLSITGTNAPVANVLQDTTGFISGWTRHQAGNYRLNFTSGVPTNKIFVPGFGVGFSGYNIYSVVSAGTIVNGYITYAPGNLVTSTYVNLNFFNSSFVFNDPAGPLELAVYCEIRFYI